MSEELIGIASSYAKEKVRGRVKIITDEKRLEEVEEGDIIVTDSDSIFDKAAQHFGIGKVVEIIKKCKAIICEKGKFTSHVSIIMREFGKPCIINLKDATKIFENGEEIEIEGDVIRKIKNLKY
ncbi:MAG: PEP-utilizing enzyme [Candidatus Aenigmatarchaeota archaeon]